MDYLTFVRLYICNIPTYISQPQLHPKFWQGRIVHDQKGGRSSNFGPWCFATNDSIDSMDLGETTCMVFWIDEHYEIWRLLPLFGESNLQWMPWTWFALRRSTCECASHSALGEAEMNRTSWTTWGGEYKVHSIVKIYSNCVHLVSDCLRASELTC